MGSVLQVIGIMPLKKNVPHPRTADWKLKTCPECGRECWYPTNNAKLVLRVNPDMKFVCSECALKAGNSLPTRKSCFGESGRTCLKFWAAKVTRIWKMKWNRSCAWSRAHRGSPRRGCARWRTSHGENGPSSLSYMILFRQTSVCTMESRFIHSGF